MQINNGAAGSQRRGATLVEMTFVVPVFLLFLFAVFEYGRLFMVRHVMDGAAREGARYAIVNTANGTVANVTSVVDARMAPVKNAFVGQTYTTNVFWIDSSTSTQKTPFNNAPFGESIGCTVTGTFKPLMPFFMKWTTSTVSLSSACYMLSEAN